MAGGELLPAAPTAPAVLDRGTTLGTAEVIERAFRIREVMEKVMKPNVHYGVIPGTQKPTMYQPGADVLNVTFRIAPRVSSVDDLSTADEVRYRITVQGVHQVSGEILAEGIGECSSNEEKYRWRKPVCDEEFKETPEDRRREKWQKGRGGSTYQAKQIRTSPPDVANTILKMAVKRAKIAMTINATAASDVFAQDLEDLSEELRESLAGDEGQSSGQPNGGAVPQPQRKSEAANAPTKPKSPAEKKADPPVTLVMLDRRETGDGRFYWAVKASDERKFLRPEDGEGWQEIVAALRAAFEQKKAVHLEGAAVQGQGFPNIVEVTIAATGEATS